MTGLLLHIFVSGPNSTVTCASTITNMDTAQVCYCMSIKSSPFLFRKLLFKMGQDFLDRQYQRYLYYSSSCGAYFDFV